MVWGRRGMRARGEKGVRVGKEEREVMQPKSNIDRVKNHRKWNGIEFFSIQSRWLHCCGLFIALFFPLSRFLLLAWCFLFHSHTLSLSLPFSISSCRFYFVKYTTIYLAQNSIGSTKTIAHYTKKKHPNISGRVTFTNYAPTLKANTLFLHVFDSILVVFLPLIYCAWLCWHGEKKVCGAGANEWKKWETRSSKRENQQMSKKIRR